MNGWFGESWGAPVNESLLHVETPVGRKCYWCEEVIEPGDTGFMQTTIRKEGATIEPVHLECQMRSVLGSVGHLNGKCPCYGGTEGDPEGMTRREAAAAAFALYNRQNFSMGEA